MIGLVSNYDSSVISRILRKATHVTIHEMGNGRISIIPANTAINLGKVNPTLFSISGFEATIAKKIFSITGHTKMLHSMNLLIVLGCIED
jgi:hypothetical protein